eukprot:scaffold125817_cov60-Phaeocystis_antarctica.AAC.2
MRELCARLCARRRAAGGRATATVPARDGGRVPFLPSMAAAPLSLASTESGRLGPHRRATQAELEHVAVVGEEWPTSLFTLNAPPRRPCAAGAQRHRDHAMDRARRSG